MKSSKKWAIGLVLAMAISTIAPVTYTPAANGLLIAPAPSASKEYTITLGTKENPSLTQLELKRKETITFQVYGIAEQQKEYVTYHWTVEGTSVTVDDKGVVTAVKTGTSIVKLTIEDSPSFRLIKKDKKEEQKIEEICEHEHCHCEEGIVVSAAKHTLNIIIFISLVA